MVGLIAAFGAIATANPAEKASLLAASISVAMNNTAGGLIVAITLLMAHMFLEAKTTRPDRQPGDRRAQVPERGHGARAAAPAPAAQALPPGAGSRHRPGPRLNSAAREGVKP